MSDEKYTALERETVVTTSDGDDLVHIYTLQAKFQRRLDAHPKATQVAPNAWTVPADQWSPLTGIKRTVNLSDEEKQRRAARLRASRTKGDAC